MTTHQLLSRSAACTGTAGTAPTVGRGPTVNDFGLTIATVNGTGSANANSLLVRSIFRMGVPVAGKNLLPSNIQGMATWFEIRVSPSMQLARTGETHLVVAMNRQTFDDDVAGVASDGFVLFDSSAGPLTDVRRDDCTFIGVPLTTLVTAAFDDPRRRVMLRNVAGAGALAALLSVDPTVAVEVLSERFEHDDVVRRANERAFEIGYDEALARLDCPLPFHVAPMHGTGESVLMDGNTATALGCLYAGATVAAWYPITPATSVMDNFGALCARYRRVPDPAQGPAHDGASSPASPADGLDCPPGLRNNYLIIQAEDELAAIGMVIGAGWNGARAFTSTSGPGLSLMTELLGLAYYAEIPAVVFDVQRSGPSTGMPTRTQQADLLAAAYASHGDTKHLLLFPADPAECFRFAVEAFDHAERFQTPVLVLSDFDIGSNDWVIPQLEWDDRYTPDRGRVLTLAEVEKLARFDRYGGWDAVYVAARTIPGVHPKAAYFTRGSGHDSLGGYTEAPDRYEEVVDRLAKKHAAAARSLPAPVVCRRPGAVAGVVTLGSCDGATREAIERLTDLGIPFDYLRVRSFPFQDSVREFLDEHPSCVVVEQNRDGQLRSLLAVETGAPIERLRSVRLYGGLPATVHEVAGGILGALET
jgi:2-oxoglutarate/2-oxoacid ferredoxin oxidoreductase subunit alpha